ncbi:MAG: hypothetical protein KJ077_10515 [Anaerolineae bacterium]|nr:hypothetical protein [Anaerolineae bacterium]
MKVTILVAGPYRDYESPRALRAKHLARGVEADFPDGYATFLINAKLAEPAKSKPTEPPAEVVEPPALAEPPAEVVEPPALAEPPAEVVEPPTEVVEPPAPAKGKKGGNK